MRKLVLDPASLSVQSFTADDSLAPIRAALLAGPSASVVALTCCFSDCSCPNTQ